LTCRAPGSPISIDAAGALKTIQRAFVTGGAGFIGSHIVDRLVENRAAATVYDDFSTGRPEFLERHCGRADVKIVTADVLDLRQLTGAMADHDFVFHLQANADLRGGVANTRIDLEQNTLATWNVLEAMRSKGVSRIMFASSAAVYGEPAVFPTPEDYAPLQTSLYGASKYACEAMIQAYCEYFGFQSYIFRFVSWIGERYGHGVIFDFVRKLSLNPAWLEVLGDGNQRKSYLDVIDGVNGVFSAIERATGQKNIFNVGHDDYLTVLEVADIVCDELGLKQVAYRPTGGERGWVGDSPFVLLDTARLKATGWRPLTPIEESIRRTVRYIIRNPGLAAGRFGN